MGQHRLAPLDESEGGDREIVVERCAGSDVQKRSVVVCRLTRDAPGARLAETQTFGTTTGELLRLCDWLTG